MCDTHGCSRYNLLELCRYLQTACALLFVMQLCQRSRLDATSSHTDDYLSVAEVVYTLLHAETPETESGVLQLKLAACVTSLGVLS